MRRTKPSSFVVALLLLAMPAGGADATADPIEAAARSPEGASLGLRPGMTIRLAPTVLGLGASLSRWTGDDTGIKAVSVVEAAADGLVVEWREKVKEETEGSRRRRQAFEDDRPRSGVGEPEPEAPPPDYVERVKRGRLHATGFEASRRMNLPALWPEGEHELEQGSLLWMSPTAFRELRATRQTVWRLGIVGSSLGEPVAALTELSRGLEALRARLEESEPERRAFDSIEAEADFATFELAVDGRPTAVRAILARNWFAEYVILDNQENPLILKVTLNPLSGGALDVFSPLGALKSILGYQVLELETCPDPGAEGVRYVSRDPDDCARLRFRCENGRVPFSNECGCGCAPAD